MRMTGTLPAFDDLGRWVAARTGLTLAPDRRDDLERVIRRAMARAGMGEDVAAYRRLIEADPDAFDDLLGELTIGETYFFREPGQFRFIRATILPEIRRRRGPDHVLRAWSAGCATGEEAYSLAILFREEGLADRCRLLATDLSRAALAKARRGLYGAWSLRGEGAESARPYLRSRGKGNAVAEDVRRIVTFDHHNLALDFDPASATRPGDMDLILCRNVLIYFDRGTVRAVARRLGESLAAGGWLITASTDPPLADEAPFEVVATDHGVFYRRAGAEWPVARGADESDRPGWLGSMPAQPASPRDGEGRAALPAGESPAPDRADRADAAQRIRALANRDVAAAERACAAATARQPLASDLHYLRAALLLDLGRDAEAVRAARRAIYLDRSLALAHLTLGSILQRRGDHDGAWRAYRNARDLCRARPAEEVVPLSDGEPAGRLAAAAEALMARIEAARRDHR
jgi:chemotaxis protein methyltransferase CheR